MTLLAIEHLSVAASGVGILKDLDLTIEAGEVVAIMGPNGSGKSTLARAIAGHPAYTVTSGRILFRGRDLAGLPPEERAVAGIFMGYQQPIEVPGVANADFLRLAVNARRRGRGQGELSVADFPPVLEQAMTAAEVDPSFAERELNVGFSGGQKKRNEILQMVLLEPDLAILDETDSGLDIDALRAVQRGINNFRSPDRAIVLITHYQRLLSDVIPDRVHVLANGRIVKSGDRSLAAELERTGYNWIEPA